MGEVPDILAPNPEIQATLIEDGFEGNVNYKGHGLQRAFILTVLQHLAITSHIIELQEGEESEGEVQDSAQKPELIIAIEEPELYLHPSRSRYLSELFYKLTSNEGDDRVQVIYTTHSPYFVGLDRYNNIRIVRKESLSGTSTLQSTVKQFPVSELLQELARIYDKDPGDFSHEGFIARAAPIMDVVVNEGFFADSVLVVEGLSDMGIFWKLQEIMGKDWAQQSIVVVPAEGKGKMDRPILTFKGFSIPTYFVFDADNHNIGKGDKEERTKKENHMLMRLAGVEIEDFPDTQINEGWAVFSDKLEETIKEELGEVLYNDLRVIVKDELGYTESDSVLKNVYCASRFIELVYEKGHRLLTLEEIISKVTDMKNN